MMLWTLDDYENECEMVEVRLPRRIWMLVLAAVKNPGDSASSELIEESDKIVSAIEDQGLRS